MIYDSIIIGKGLIGSAASKYLSRAENNVAVIGPDEPSETNNALVYSSHYDQARIQRIIGKDPEWTLLNLQSIRQYNSIEKESGIAFHSTAGCLYVNPYGSDHYLTQAPPQAIQFGLHYDPFENGENITGAFPDFKFPQTSKGLYEEAPAGFINPRLLIKAQLNIFQKNNGVIINDVASNIVYKKDCMQVATMNGSIY